MRVSLDGQELFDEPVTIEAESIKRQSIERSAIGVDGVLSIDLGSRGRKIRQKGELRARSRIEMNSKAEAVSVFMDGEAHTLTTADGETFENTRIDSVSVKNERASGSGVVADYEIVYLQLMVQ
jgi:hypothetical protein